MTGRELAVEFTDLWKDLETSQINTMLAKNIPYELLEFFSAYAEEFAAERLSDDVAGELKDQLPNLLVIGYLIRVLEEKLG